ncbi:MAG: NTP transferase domain-containing protein [Bacillota bacterium]|nr:NTP transferase domain-containing protein [Bacillota bacterium]
MEKLRAVVLAAGEGKRMRSKLPKVLHPLCGRPMIDYIIESAVTLTADLTVVIGHGASLVKPVLGSQLRAVLQEKQLGTGHAVRQALNEMADDGKLLVLCGDTPLVEANHLESLVAQSENLAAAVATVEMDNPTGYGRIIRNRFGLVEKIIEEKDAALPEKDIHEINTGMYCFDLKLLHYYIHLIKNNNAQKEYYLTDVISLLSKDGYKVGVYKIGDSRVGLGINDREQLAEATRLMRKKINRKLLLGGVTMLDPDSVYIDYDVVIGQDTIIYPNVVIEKNTTIGNKCIIGPNVHLKNSKIHNGVAIRFSAVENSIIKSNTVIDLFSNLS